MLTTRYELYLLNVTQVNRSRRPGFDARSVRVRFFGVQGGTGTGFFFSPNTYIFSLCVLFHQKLRTVPLLLPEGQTVEA